MERKPNQECGFIDDGYTRTAVIPREPGYYPEVYIEYRPMLASEIQVMNRRVGAVAKGFKDESEGIIAGEKLICEYMAKHLVFWNLTDRKGSPVDISTECCTRLDSRLSAHIFAWITGQAKLDIAEEEQEKNS